MTDHLEPAQGVCGRGPWATAPELAHYLGVPVGTIYRWAHEDHWVKRPVGRRIFYALWEAYASHNRRRESCDTPSENPCF